MRISDWLIPKEKIFFELLEKESKVILRGVLELNDLLKNYKNVSHKRKKIKNLEMEADEIVHEIYNRLNSSFITPVDQEDIARLASFYDDVIDSIDAIAALLYLFKVTKPDYAMKRFCRIILRQVEQIDHALLFLPKMKQKEIDLYCAEANRLENLADDLFRESLAKLFNNNNDSREIIKLKEIYEFFEEASDKCEHVTNILRNTVMKNL